MSIPGSTNPLLLFGDATGGALQIERSLRFNSSDSAYLSRTPASSGNRKTWTWAGWVKRSGIGGELTLFASGTAADDSTFGQIIFSVNNTLTFNAYFTTWRSTAQVLRDPSAWYHIVVAFDTTQATASNRVKIYINGSEVTSFGLSSNPTQNVDYAINQNLQHTIGRYDLGGGGNYFPGYLANIHFIDGQQLTPSSFTETDATTGQLVPKTYTGSYGTNGFNLLFADNSSNTAATLGKDTSGNSNNWTPNNLSVTADGPTSVAAASGALPILNTTDTYGGTLGSGVRSDSNASSLSIATPFNDLTDQAPTGRTSSIKSISTIGSVTSSGSNSKFYGTTHFWSGSGTNYLLASDSTDYSFGTGDFTIETWYHITTSRPQGTYNIVCSVFSIAGTEGATGAWHAYVNNTNNRSGMYAENVGDFTVAYTFPLNQWVHVAYVRSGNTLTIYHDGIGQIATTSLSGVTFTNPYASGLLIGRLNPTNLGGTIGQHAGYIQDLRIYKGVAKYTSYFNPPSATANASDSLVDSPTNYGTDTGVGGTVRGNYCTLNPLDNSSGLTLANGNLDGSETGGGHKATRATIKFPASGKWYYEGRVTTLGGACCIGAATNAAANPDINASGSYYILVNSSGNVQRYQSFASYTGFDTPSVGTILRVAYDADAQKLWLGLNGLWMNSSTGTTGDPATGANATFSSVTDIYPAIDQQTSAVAVNFGQRAFAYTAPSGYKALCTQNLPASLVTKSNTVMDVALYTGNGGTQTVSGLAFEPDLVWLKGRSVAYSHQLYDQVRGAGKVLGSNLTSGESTVTDNLTAFTSTGFTLGNDAGTNQSSATYVGWAWDAGTSTVSNTQGSITSQVRANATAGFSVVTWAAGSAPVTIGHGLGVAPQFIIFKSRTSSTDWQIGHASLGWTKRLFFDTSSSDTTTAAWNDTSPTSTVFTVGSTGYQTGNMVAYCFAPVVGYSSFGSYVGNGSSDGPFVYTGFRPRWILIKQSSGSGENWRVLDTARSTYNPADNRLLPNSSAAEAIGVPNELDMLSNGFKFRATDGASNGSGATYIYAAFAEAPFNYSRAR